MFNTHIRLPLFYNLMETTSPYLFVYGTLLLATNEFGQYLNTHCKLVGTGKFKGLLYDIGQYPGAIADDNASSYVYGSIFLMDNAPVVLQVLDDYEGLGLADPVPYEYLRELHKVETDNNPVNCWVYFYNWPVEKHHQILSGNYNKYLSNQF